MNNKKIKYVYIILFLIIIGMIFNKGIGNGIFIKSYDDYIDKGMIDGFSGTIEIFIPNIIIAFSCLIFNCIITFNKLNSIKNKYLIFLGILIMNLFITIGINQYSGGISGINEFTNINLLNFIFVI